MRDRRYSVRSEVVEVQMSRSLLLIQGIQLLQHFLVCLLLPV